MGDVADHRHAARAADVRGRARRTPSPGRVGRRCPCCGRRSVPARSTTCGPRSRCASGSGGPPGTCRRPATPGPRRAAQTWSRNEVGVLGLDVAGAVLEPEQVARGRLRARGGRRAAEAELRPADRDPPKPIRTRLRMACTATCGSFAHAWMQMSPPLRAGSRSSAGKRGRSISAGGRCSRGPNRSSNSEGPNPIVSVSARRGQVERLAGVFGRGVGDAADRAVRRASWPGRHPLRGERPLLEQVDAARRGWVFTSSATKCIWSCAGVVMPAWTGP